MVMHPAVQVPQHDKHPSWSHSSGPCACSLYHISLPPWLCKRWDRPWSGASAGQPWILEMENNYQCLRGNINLDFSFIPTDWDCWFLWDWKELPIFKITICLSNLAEIGQVGFEIIVEKRGKRCCINDNESLIAVKRITASLLSWYRVYQGL